MSKKERRARETEELVRTAYEKQVAQEEAARKTQELEMNRRYDSQKVINGCDGAFEPENRMPHGALRPNKTREDRMPVDKRPRVIAAQKRAGRMAA